MTTGIGAELYLDGVKVNDGTPGENELDPVALSPLTITWGRSTTVDQPSASTCSVSIQDLGGGVAFVDQFAIGKQIDVQAHGTVYPVPSTATFRDPGFDLDPELAAGFVNATGAIGTRRAVSAPHAVEIHPVDRLRTYSVIFPPAPFSGSPAAWDDIAATSAGQTWQYGATVFLPPGARGELRPVLFSSPLASSATIVDRPLAITAAGWTVVVGEFVPNEDRRRVGVELKVYPSGDRWADLDPDLAWVDAGTLNPDPRPPDPADPVTRTNYAINPNFEKDVLGWRPEGVAVLTRNTTTPITGTGSGHMVGGDSYVSPFPPATAGQYWSLSADYRTDGPVTGAPCLYLAQTGGTLIGSKRFNLPLNQPTPGRFSVTFGPLGAGATGVIGAVFAAPEGIDFDNVLLEPTSAPSPYFDGSSPAAGGFGYRWTGAANASSSQEYGQADEWAWLDHDAVFVDDIAVLSPEAGTERTVLVFQGRITDLVASFDAGLGSVVVDLTAADFTADTENRKIGDEPWLVETAAARMNRILTLAGTGLVGTIDDTIGETLVSYQDVDSTGAMSLLRDLAQSLDGVLWAEAHLAAGGYVHIEDPGLRASLRGLEQGDDGLVHIVEGASSVEALDISACDVLRDPVQWQQAVADVSTRARVSWLEQLPPDPESGQLGTTEHTVEIIDAELEQDFGTRSISVSTILQAEADALAVADRVLARTHLTDWRASGITIDDDRSLDEADDAAAMMILDLLDGAGRNGKALRLVDLPIYAPNHPSVGVFLEGGEYTFEAGTWTLSLTVTSSTAQGRSVAWDELDPGWAWAEFDPAISWLDLIGVSGPGTPLERITA
jgi:hypothetical protein